MSARYACGLMLFSLAVSMMVMARARVSASVSAPCKKPILASNADWAQGAFSRIVVDGHTTIGQEQAEGLLTTEVIAKGLGQIALAWNTQGFCRKFYWSLSAGIART